MQVPPISLNHFSKLMGPYGLYQHATKREPNLAEGYCVDDNARAVMVLLEYIQQFPLSALEVEPLLASCFSFLEDARYGEGTYYNFRDAKGVWLTHDISEDMYARLARTYAYVLQHDTNSNRKEKASTLLLDLLPTLQTLTAPRAQAETCIAVTTLPEHFLREHPEFTALQTTHTKNLLSLWNTQSSSDWPWFEPSMTYANAILPHSLLSSPSHETQECLHASAAFLIDTTIQDNTFMPIGSVGWYPKGGVASHDNQQAIEAGTMFDFLLAYQSQFPKKVSDEVVAAPYLWFFGNNTKSVLMANKEIGACLDGLFLTHTNPNYGAESMLAYLWAELLMQRAPESVRAIADRFLKS